MIHFNNVLKSAIVTTIAAAGFFGATGAASARVVNIDVEGYRTAGGGMNGTQDKTYIGSGAAGGGTVFNGVTHLAVSDGSSSATTGDEQTLTGTNLNDSNGNPTSVDFTVGQVGLDTETAAPDTDAATLFNDYVFNHSAGNSTNATFTLSDLQPGLTYDVYLYAGFANVGNLSNTTITGGTATPFTASGVFNSGNTAHYTVVADIFGKINGTMGSGTQILAGVTISYIPEPASLSLLAVGGLALLRRRHA